MTAPIRGSIRRFESTRLAIVLLGLALVLTATDLLRRWDNLLYDAQLRLFPRAPPADVVIVAIDEESLAALGRWPWPRRLHARMVERLTRRAQRSSAWTSCSQSRIARMRPATSCSRARSGTRTSRAVRGAATGSRRSAECDPAAPVARRIGASWATWISSSTPTASSAASIFARAWNSRNGQRWGWGCSSWVSPSAQPPCPGYGATRAGRNSRGSGYATTAF